MRGWRSVGHPRAGDGLAHGLLNSFTSCKLTCVWTEGSNPCPRGFVLDLKRLRTYDFWPIRGFPDRQIPCLAFSLVAHRPGHDSEGEQYV